MTLYIKNMISIRCMMVVQSELRALDLHDCIVDFGVVETGDILTKEKCKELRIALFKWDLELMDDPREIFIERIKSAIFTMVNFEDELPKIKVSKYLGEKLHHDYGHLSNLFSKTIGTTIEHYVINAKIDRVKQLLLYSNLNLTEISYMLNYSSVAHLSNQFRKVTGNTTTYFKFLKSSRLHSLECL